MSEQNEQQTDVAKLPPGLYKLRLEEVKEQPDGKIVIRVKVLQARSNDYPIQDMVVS